MGSIIEINDTLQLTKEQGFPVALELKHHLKTLYKTEDFSDKIFEFRNNLAAKEKLVMPEADPPLAENCQRSRTNQNRKRTR